MGFFPETSSPKLLSATLTRCYAQSMDVLVPSWPDWKPISRVGGALFLLAYLVFLFHAWRDNAGFLFPDFVNLMIHEAGHVLFGWGGETIMLLGGTLGELLVPLACAAGFFYKRELYGFAFSLFWFFENFLYIGTYMADARTSALPLVNSDESDWTILFTQWNILIYDQRLGHFVRAIGWVGMLAIVTWLSRKTYRSEQPELRPLKM
jgi:hypothetical protein